MGPPIDDVAFLSRSGNRANVLELLADDIWTRRELRDETGLSQPTIGRILDGFEERGWAETNDHGYTLTPLGGLLADEFSALLHTVETIHVLRDVADHLPFEDMDFDLSLLVEATVTRAKPEDNLAHMRRQDAIIEQSDHVRTLCRSFSPAAIKAQHDRILNGDCTGEAIVASDALDTLTAHDELTEMLAELVASERTAFYRYDGPIPAMISQFDKKAGIVPLNDEGLPYGVFIETDSEEIRRWVAGTLDTRREQAAEITVDDVRA